MPKCPPPPLYKTLWVKKKEKKKKASTLSIPEEQLINNTMCVPVFRTQYTVSSLYRKLPETGKCVVKKNILFYSYI